jgi:membrane protease YdiL (CAAX protease family)
MLILDHVFVILLTIVAPVTGFISYRRLVRRAAAGENIDRNVIYRETAILQWSLLFLALVGWSLAGRPWSALGMSLDVGRNFVIGALLAMAVIVFLAGQFRVMTKSDDEKVLRLRKSMGDVLLMMPRNGSELARFYGVSVTAGIVEEILWRGFLFWYLGAFMPLWAAAVVSTIAFGLAHAYQGLSQVPAITLVGAVFAGMYVLTGSVWLPIILHAAVDIVQGRIAYEVMRRDIVTHTEMNETDASQDACL